MAKKRTAESKQTSKWVLGGDGISNFKIPEANKKAVAEINRQKSAKKKGK